MKKHVLSLVLILSLVAASCDSGDIQFSRSDYYDSNSGTGQGGSMARFTIVDDHLYTVDDQNLRAFDISSPENMTQISVQRIDWSGVETIFAMKHKLFLGTSTGMHIMDISNPQNILHLSSYEHIVSCDPVVAQDNYAYVTLNSKQERCNIGVDELHVIDISNIEAPKKIQSYPLDGPRGLGIRDSLLFVCDEDQMKVFDCSDPLHLILTQSIPVKGTYDVIPNQNQWVLISAEGLKQYSYENNQLTLLSSILINN